MKKKLGIVIVFTMLLVVGLCAPVLTFGYEDNGWVPPPIENKKNYITIILPDAKLKVERYGTMRYVDVDFNDGTWRHLVHLYNDSDDKLYLYVNGVSDAVAVADSSVDTTNAGSIVLGDTGGGIRWMAGGIALVRIYNTVLTTAEMLSHYNQERHLFGV